MTPESRGCARNEASSEHGNIGGKTVCPPRAYIRELDLELLRVVDERLECCPKAFVVGVPTEVAYKPSDTPRHSE